MSDFWSQAISAALAMLLGARWLAEDLLNEALHWLRGRWRACVACLQSLQIRTPHNLADIQHTRSAAIHAQTTLGERLADAVASGMGSWRFILIQTALVLLWMLGNAWLLTHPFDPYPFILLNLAFSTQAAYAAPILQMASNRQAAKDRLRDDHEAQEVDLMTRQLQLLETINRQQLTILEALHLGAPGVSHPDHIADVSKMVTLPVIPTITTITPSTPSTPSTPPPPPSATPDTHTPHPGSGATASRRANRHGRGPRAGA